MEIEKTKMISVTDILKKYNKNIVLKDLTFNVYEHEFVALIGNNGCGKTTLVNLLCNLESATNGKIEILESEIKNNSYLFRNNLGIILSSPYYVEEFNVIEYLRFVCKFQLVQDVDIEERIDNIISFFELEPFSNSKIKTLSKGNQMKVTLCASLIHNPQILIFDEPFINLDIETTDKLIVLLQSLYGKKTLFITSHNLDLVVDLCTRFLILDDGNIKLDIKKTDQNDDNELKNRIKTFLKTNKDFKDLSWLE